jgi:glycerol-3-phosphate dehydrogenase (NAD(P)+)
VLAKKGWPPGVESINSVGMNFCIHPAGAWGTALALHLNRNGHRVTLVPHTMEEALEIASARENKSFLPGFALPVELQISGEPGPALMEAEWLLLAPPSRFLRPTCQRLRSFMERSSAWALQGVLCVTKGLEEGSNKPPSAILQEELPQLPSAVLSGPTFASQVAAGQPSAIVLAGQPGAAFEALQEALSGPSLRVYSTDDVVGVELGGSLKNVYAIAAGCCDGLGLADNAKAALLTRSLHEMVRIGKALGGRIETFYGLSGLGDLVLTSTGRESRNRTFGEQIASGKSFENPLSGTGPTVEGVRTCACYAAVCEKNGIEAPILSEIYQILFKDKSPASALSALMQRDLKAERS